MSDEHRQLNAEIVAWLAERVRRERPRAFGLAAWAGDLVREWEDDHDWLVRCAAAHVQHVFSDTLQRNEKTVANTP